MKGCKRNDMASAEAFYGRTLLYVLFSFLGNCVNIQARDDTVNA